MFTNLFTIKKNLCALVEFIISKNYIPIQVQIDGQKLSNIYMCPHQCHQYLPSLVDLQALQCDDQPVETESPEGIYTIV